MFKFLKRKKDKNSEQQPTIQEEESTPAPDLPTTESIAQTNENSQQVEPNEPPVPAPITQPEPESAPAEKKVSLFKRLTSSLAKTRNNLTSGLANVFLGKKEIDDELLDEIETQLITADVGIEAAESLVESLTAGISRKEIKDPEAVMNHLKNGLLDIIQPYEQPLNIYSSNEPFVILMIGVNGSGKTTTIGKLAKKYQDQGLSVMLAAGDTFRAAAVEQLQVWGERNQVPVIAQHTGADSASVAFDALSSARAKNIDVLIIDTAGRLHTADNLMEELKKVKRVLGKQLDGAPHEVMLVLDAGIGQNALLQAEKFNQAIGLNAITLTKLDGTAKGGILFAIANQLKLPIRYIGCGEQIDDLRDFSAQDFIDALFYREPSE